jgi:hypothetical protein
MHRLLIVLFLLSELFQQLKKRHECMAMRTLSVFDPFREGGILFFPDCAPTNNYRTKMMTLGRSKVTIRETVSLPPRHRTVLAHDGE